MPAMSPARSESLPSEAETDSTRSRSKVAGNAPYRRMAARSSASACGESAEPTVMTTASGSSPSLGLTSAATDGADWTVPSTTIASCRLGSPIGKVASAPVASRKNSPPSLLNSGTTTQPPPAWLPVKTRLAAANLCSGEEGGPDVIDDEPVRARQVGLQRAVVDDRQTALGIEPIGVRAVGVRECRTLGKDAQNRPKRELTGRADCGQSPGPILHTGKLDEDRPVTLDRDLRLLHAPEVLDATPHDLDGRIEGLGVGVLRCDEHDGESALEIETELRCPPGCENGRERAPRGSRASPGA